MDKGIAKVIDCGIGVSRHSNFISALIYRFPPRVACEISAKRLADYFHLCVFTLVLLVRSLVRVIPLIDVPRRSNARPALCNGQNNLMAMFVMA